MSDIIRTIVGLLLAALRSLAICMVMLMAAMLSASARFWRWAVVPRPAFINHPPEAWAAP